jgi:hypothetical protein
MLGGNKVRVPAGCRGHFSNFGGFRGVDWHTLELAYRADLTELPCHGPAEMRNRHKGWTLFERVPRPA